MDPHRPRPLLLAAALALAGLAAAPRALAHPASAASVEQACAAEGRVIREDFRGDCADCHRPPRAHSDAYPVRARIARLRDAFRALESGATGAEAEELVDALLTEVCPAPPNQAPTIEPLEPVQGREGDELRVELRASDPEGAPIRFEADSLPEGARIESEGPDRAALLWRPAAEDVGEHALPIRALDAGSPPLEAEAELWVEVAPNLAPTMEAPAWVRFEAGAPIELRVSAHDPEGDPLTLEVFGLPGGASFESGPDGVGSLLWTPEPGTLGRFELGFEARDDRDPPGIGAGATTLLVGDPADAASAESVRWDEAARELRVRGATAAPRSAVQLEDAETGRAIATELASESRTFALSARLARPPCAIRVRSGRWLSEPREVEDAPAECGARALAAFRLGRAEWRSASRELRIEAHQVPADAAIDLFDADTDAPLAHLRADPSGRLRYRTRTDTPPCRIRVFAEGVELTPVPIERAPCPR